jgi:hypothetical protein
MRPAPDESGTAGKSTLSHRRLWHHGREYRLNLYLYLVDSLWSPGDNSVRRSAGRLRPVDFCALKPAKSDVSRQYAVASSYMTKVVAA